MFINLWFFASDSIKIMMWSMQFENKQNYRSSVSKMNTLSSKDNKSVIYVAWKNNLPILEPPRDTIAYVHIMRKMNGALECSKTRR